MAFRTGLGSWASSDRPEKCPKTDRVGVLTVCDLTNGVQLALNQPKTSPIVAPARAPGGVTPDRVGVAAQDETAASPRAAVTPPYLQSPVNPRRSQCSANGPSRACFEHPPQLGNLGRDLRCPRRRPPE